MTAPGLTMAQVAQRLACHYDTFLDLWPAMVRNEGFPAPYLVGKRRRWDAAAIDRWQAAQAADLAQQIRRPAAANDRAEIKPFPVDPRDGAGARFIDRQRDEITSLMGIR